MDSKKSEKKRIAIIGYKFCYGGLEKVMSDISILLENKDNDVVTIVLDKEICYPNGGQLIKLGEESRIVKYFKLNEILRKNKFDYIIDFRYRVNPLMELLFLFVFFRKKKAIYTVHSSNIEAYFTKYNWIAKLILKRIYKVVCVSNTIKEELKKKYKINNADVIYNGFDFDKINRLSLVEKVELPIYKYIIAVGRLSKEKQFDKLIEVYSKSILPSHGIHMLFLGDGVEENFLKRKRDEFELQDKIEFLGFKDNPYVFLKNAVFSILCSSYEGFPMVILESLAVGTPVVSFDCPSGPSEIIENEYNGLLIKDQNFDELLDKINLLINNIHLTDKYRNNTQNSVLKFENKVIIENWNLIFK